MTILNLPEGFSLAAYLGDYMTLLGYVLPIAIAFFSYGLVRRVFKKAG